MQSESAQERTSLLDVYTAVVCPYSQILSIVFGLLVIFIATALAAVIMLSPPNSSYYIALLVILIDAPVALLLGVLLYICRRYHTKR